MKGFAFLAESSLFLTTDTMTEQEGVIKYRLDYHPAPPRHVAGFTELNAWRDLLWRLGVIGQDEARYGGLGYGNLSLRLNGKSFLITGTQTGHLPHLTAEHYSWVRDARPEENYLAAEGPLPPSSEALTHAAVYGAGVTIRCVAHGHSPAIWANAKTLKLACVAEEIAYGTPAMAQAVAALVKTHPDQGLIVMLGHRDGLLTYGQTVEQSCWLMARCLAQALMLTDDSEGDVNHNVQTE